MYLVKFEIWKTTQFSLFLGKNVSVLPADNEKKAFK